MPRRPSVRRQSAQLGSVCIVAAHPDDEVLGCGGTIARLALEGHAVHLLLVADGESSRFSRDTSSPGAPLVAKREANARSAAAILGIRSVQLAALPDNRLDSLALLEIVQIVEAFVRRHTPRLLLTHHAGDVNIDHRIVHDAVVAACRPLPGQCVRTLLFFEVPSSTEWRPPASAEQFSPNWFVDVSKTLNAKMKALKAYSEELRAYPHARSIEGIEALARWRGVSVGVDAAEAFVLGRHLT